MRKENYIFFWEKIKEYYGLIVVLLLSLVAVIIPFLLSNNLEGFDSAGHLASAYYIKNFFWPWPDGWNMSLMSGFPQGIFYPSGFHWLAAALSFAVSLETAIKLLIALAIILFPIGIFLLSKKALKRTLPSAVATVLVSFFYFFEVGLNDNLFADLFFGMLPHLVSLTIFPFFLWSVFRLLENTNKWRLPVFLLTITILVHPITALVSFFLVIVIFAVSFRDRKAGVALTKVSLFTLLSTVFWLAPVFVNLPYSSGSSVGYFYSPIITILAPFIIFLNFLVLRKKSSSGYFFKSIAILSILVLLSSFFGSFLSLDGFPFHFARFIIYPLILAPIELVYLLSLYRVNWPLINLTCVFSLLFYLLFFRITPLGPFQTTVLEEVGDYYQSGRVIALGSSSSLDARFHSTRMKLATDYGFSIAEGLFVESSPNGWFIMSLLRSWDGNNDNFTWAYRHLRDVADLSWGARLFGVNYEYRIADDAPSDTEETLVDRWSDISVDEGRDKLIQDLSKEERDLYFKLSRERLLDDENIISKLGTNKSGFYYQSFYKVNDTDLAEAVYLRPVKIDNDWDQKTKEWWSTDWLRASSTDYLYDKPLLVYRAPVSDWELANFKEHFSITDISSRMDSFVVDASSLSSPAPIYVKVGYFPFWKAYNDQDQELEIYKASPNFMLVYGQGKIIFKYVKPFYYYLGYIISALTLAGILITGLRAKRRKIKEK